MHHVGPRLSRPCSNRRMGRKAEGGGETRRCRSFRPEFWPQEKREIGREKSACFEIKRPFFTSGPGKVAVHRDPKRIG